MTNNFKIENGDLYLIEQIAKKVKRMFIYYRYDEIVNDLVTVHCKNRRINLCALSRTSAEELRKEISGFRNDLNRDTGRLIGIFNSKYLI